MKIQKSKLSVALPGFVGGIAFLISYRGIGGSGAILPVNDANAEPVSPV